MHSFTITIFCIIKNTSNICIKIQNNATIMAFAKKAPNGLRKLFNAIVNEKEKNKKQEYHIEVSLERCFNDMWNVEPAVFFL